MTIGRVPSGQGLRKIGRHVNSTLSICLLFLLYGRYLMCVNIYFECFPHKQWISNVR